MFFGPGKERQALDFVSKFSCTNVNIDSAKYGTAFISSKSSLRLGEFYDRYVRDLEAEKVFLFTKGGEICQDGYEAVLCLLEQTFREKLMGDKLFVHPNKTGGLDEVNFY